MFDIVITIGPNDVSIFEEQIIYTKKNIIGYRNIYIVSNNDVITQVNKNNSSDCTFIDECIYPFSKNDIIQLKGNNHRNGWYLQQLIKLYSGFVLPNILDKYLVIDCDTFFLKPTIFIENDKCLYNFGNEYHIPYFEHMNRLYNGLEKVNQNMSGICHHMIFETVYLKELFKIIEDEHKKDFWVIFLEKVDDKDYLISGASEYEIYFNFMLKYHSDNITIRKLEWLNTGMFIDTHHIPHIDYISIHSYLRPTI